MKELRLTLKKEWFEMTKTGIKTEDYREINEYWFVRLVFNYKKVFKYFTGYLWDDDIYRIEGINYILTQKTNMIAFNPFSRNIMTLGYPKSTDSDRILKIQHKGIEIREGDPEWGAEKGKIYFVIKHGEII